jgi:SEC-C motif
MRFTPPARAKIVNLKYALNHLICWILDNCPRGDPSESRIDPSTYLAAGDALLFANGYEALLVAYRLYFHGHYDLEITGNRLRFVPRHSRASNRDFVEHELWRRREETSVREILSIPTEGILTAAERGLRRVDEQTVDYDIDPRVMDYCLRTVVDAVQATLPLDISNGSYTLGDSREVWRVLMALAHCHAIHCLRAQTVGVKGGAVNSAVMRLGRTQLANLVSSFSQLTPHACDRVIADLILPSTGKRDLRAQPLIEVDGTVLLTPHLLVALAWEPCMQVLWNRLYSGVYGKYIADHKKSLATEFAACFDHTQFAVSAMRKLRDLRGREVGDADVAVYDPTARLLVLFELKWLNPPEDIPEVLSADSQLRQGVKQAARARDFARDNIERVLSILFPLAQRLGTPVDVRAFVLCRGSLGSEALGEVEPGVYDYETCAALAKQLRQAPLSSLCDAIEASLSLSETPSRLHLTHEIIEVCGWDIRVPALTEEGPFPAKTPRNSPCPCRSGRKYKQCCGH